MKSILFKCIFASFVGVSFSACVTDRALVVSVPVASMSHTSLPKGKAVSQGAAGNVKFCAGEKALSTKEKTVGLLDELIVRGQRRSKSKFLTDVQLFTSVEGTNCFELDYKKGVVGAVGASPKEETEVN